MGFVLKTMVYVAKQYNIQEGQQKADLALKMMKNSTVSPG